MKKLRDFLEQYRFSLRITYAASRKYCVWQFVLTLVLSALPFANMYLWKCIIDVLLNAEMSDRFMWLTVYFSLYALLYAVTTLLRKAAKFVSFQFNDRVNVYVENLLINKYKEVDLAFFDSGNKADKLSYINSIKYSMVSLSQTGFDTLECCLILIYSFIAFCTVHVGLACLLMALFVPIILCKMKMNRLRVRYDEDSSVCNRRVEYFKSQFKQKNSIADIKLYGLKEYFLSKYEEAWQELYQKKKKHTLLSTILLMIQLAISHFASSVLLYGVCIIRLSKQLMTVGDATYAVSACSQFHSAMNNLVDSLIYMEYSYKSMSAVREFLEMTSDVRRGGDTAPHFEHTIEFSHVSFRYPGTEEYVLQDCSFTLRAGEVVGFVGENGCGKSTIVKLLLRLYDVSEGQIFVDGVDVTQCDIRKYRELFSPLFQDYVSYSLTLRENVALSDWSGVQDDERIRNALQQCEMLPVAEGFPKGLDAPMTRYFEQDGQELSGGQWQRIALSRVFFAPRDFIVLDEPSAALDVFAEERVFEQFRNMQTLSQGRSLLIISHRLSSVVDADRIFVVRDKRIVEQGSHAELMERNGYYAELFQVQAGKYMG